MDINVGFIEDSNIKEIVTNIDVRVESEGESSDSQSDKAESSASKPIVITNNMIING
jgi:hypothetical protein